MRKGSSNKAVIVLQVESGERSAEQTNAIETKPQNGERNRRDNAQNKYFEVSIVYILEKCLQCALISCTKTYASHNGLYLFEIGFIRWICRSLVKLQLMPGFG